MDALRQAIIGKGNRSISVIGVCLIVAAILEWIGTGELDMTSMTAGFAGLSSLLARGGGTGSDAPKPPPAE